MKNLALKKISKRLQFILSGGMLYILIFNFVEKRDVPITILHTNFDDMIPFCEYFIIPYFMWFLFVAATVIYFGVFSDNDEKYHELIGSLAFGMGCFLLISLFFPNGQDLRPQLGAGENIFQKMCIMLYSTDTSTNVLPSLHCYNAVVCGYALLSDKKTRSILPLAIFTAVLTVSIILSTMFLKQHTVIDVIAALFLNYIAYFLFTKERLTERILRANDNYPYVGGRHSDGRKKVHR